MSLVRRVALLPILALAAACTGEVAPAVPPPATTGPATPPPAPVPSSCTALLDPLPSAPPEDDPEARTSVKEPADPRDLCAVAESNLQRAAAAILAAPRAPPRGASLPPWDHLRKPARLDEVARRFALRKEEREALAQRGFVVPARLGFPSYTAAFHELHQSEMPLWVSVDAVLHAVFRGSDSVIAELERARLGPLLDRIFAALRCALPELAPSYPDEVARDLDVYLTVGRSLLTEKAELPVFEANEPQVKALVAAAREARGLEVVELFGRPRYVDFTQYTPRGHYAEEGAGLAPYFRAVTWLSRLELNLVSRSSRSSASTPDADPRETPREAVDALALADLCARAGVMDGVRALERTFSIFAGRREDVSLAELGELRQKAGIGSLREPQVFERFKAALGDGFPRTVKLHYMPMGTTTLPAITTLLGPRVVADAVATQPLVEPRTPNRHVVGAADLGYALGHDRAKAHLGAELRRHPELAARLEEARAIARAPASGEDLYALWYRGVLALAERPAGALPSFMRGEAFADLRLASAITAFGQLRHANVLFVGQPYDQGGCEIPDAYVEPAPAVYDALAAYAERGAAALGAVDPRDEARARAYFGRLAGVLRVLAAVSRDELSGEPLSEEERRFLAMVVEMRMGSSGGPPTYTGWYFDMFPTRTDALADADFIADHFTSGHEQVISYVGAAPPRLGVFVVDAGGEPRVVVGPVARAYEHQGPLARRIDDAGAKKLTTLREPWAASYAVAAPAEPEVYALHEIDGKLGVPVVSVTAARAGTRVTVELLDHHRRPLQSLTRTVGNSTSRFVFRKATDERPVEALHLAAGEAHAWRELMGEASAVQLGKKPD